MTYVLKSMIFFQISKFHKRKPVCDMLVPVVHVRFSTVNLGFMFMNIIIPNTGRAQLI